MPMNWNDQADAKLLIGIIKTAKPKIDYDALAAYMGEGCTAYGIQHRIRKIQAKANESGDTSTSIPSKGTTTPKAKKATTPRKTPAKSNPKSKRKNTKDHVSEGLDDEGEPSPSKKVKTETIKEENDDNTNEEEGEIKEEVSDGDQA